MIFFDYYTAAFNVPQILKKFINKQDKRIINFADAVILCNEKKNRADCWHYAKKN